MTDGYVSYLRVAHGAEKYPDRDMTHRTLMDIGGDDALELLIRLINAMWYCSNNSGATPKDKRAVVILESERPDLDPWGPRVCSILSTGASWAKMSLLWWGVTDANEQSYCKICRTGVPKEQFTERGRKLGFCSEHPRG